jgi:triosephosphate isomerase
MSRRPLIAGNWKLNLGPSAARAYALALRERLAGVDEVDLAVFPTALSLAPVIEVLRETPLTVGVQQTDGHASGAHTGANSAVMARELGCDWALAGHSECRQERGDTDERVNASVREARSAGLLPILCIGESLEQRRAGKLEAVLERQLSKGFAGMEADEVATCTLAYEPIWAIGTGVTASPQEAQAAHAFVRGWLVAHYPPYVAAQLRILYGGSVNAANAAELLANPDIDGALVGGASLIVEAFAGIVQAARG